MTLATTSPPSTRGEPATEPVPVTVVPPPIRTVPPVVDGSIPEPAPAVVPASGGTGEPAQRADEPMRAPVPVPLDRSPAEAERCGSSGRSAFRFDPSSGTVLVVAVILVSVVAVASFTVSFAGLLSVAGWASIPAFIRPLVPIAIDATQLVYTLTAVIVKARGGRAWFSWLAITLFTAVSVVANAAHVLAPRFTPDAAWYGWTAQDLAGAAICALMPIALFFATHTVVGIVTGTETQTEEPVRSAPPVPAEPNGPEHETAGPIHRAETAALDRDDGTERSPEPMPESVRPIQADPVDRAAAAERSIVDPVEVLSLHERGLSYAKIAVRLGTNKTRVGRIVRAGINAAK